MITGINRITLAVKDLARSFHFYVDVLGLKPMAKWARGAYLLAGNDWVCLSLDTATREGPKPEYTHFAFSVDGASFQKWVELARSGGVKVWKENTSEGDLESRLASLKEKPFQGLEMYV